MKTNKLRNIAKLFAHLLTNDSLSWDVFEMVHLNEDETTSSSYIFLKISFHIEKALLEHFRFMFPIENLRDTRYAINFYTSIGLGPLTDGVREYLKIAPKLIMENLWFM